MVNTRRGLIAGVLCLAAISEAFSTESISRPNAEILLKRADSGEWQLQAVQAPIPKLLTALAGQAGNKIHHSFLNHQLVNATCVSKDVRGLLQCLLGSGVNMAFRQSGSGTEEVWIMSSSLSQVSDVSSQCAELLVPGGINESGKADTTEELLRNARNKDSAKRAQAIAELATAQPRGDKRVHALLNSALSDTNPAVRAQAIAALANREGESAVSEQLRAALKDRNSEVRLMALDSIEQDSSLLNLALQDADVVVRQLAETKLESLTKQ